MYESSLLEVTDVEDFLKVCNKEGYKIIDASYISDSQQILFVVEKPKPIIRKVEPEPEEEG